MKNNTVSKGYRLKPETHELIEKVKFVLKCTSDKLINESIKYYYKKQINVNKKSIINKFMKTKNNSSLTENK